MHTAVMTLPFASDPLEAVLERLDGHGVDTVELNLGSDFSEPIVDVADYLDDEAAQRELLDLLDAYGMEVCALGGVNNPLHPDEGRAAEADRELRDVIRLADQLGVDTVRCFSGLPGGAPGDVTPNWITAPFPPEHAEAYEYQWEEVAIPYWRDLDAFAADHDTDVAIEIHFNTLVHTPGDLLRLREETGERIGASFDPAHMYYQGIDVFEAIRSLGEAIHYVEGSDLVVYEEHARRKGMIDPVPHSEQAERSWSFCSVGYGHGREHWRKIVRTLEMVGYDGPIAVQQLNTLSDPEEGLKRSLSTLEDVVF